HVGHGAIIHGAEIQRNCLIGMNSVIMDHVILGVECIVGAMSFIKEKTEIPSRSLVVGNPAKIIKEVTDEMINWKSKGTALYQQLTKDSLTMYKECIPLKEMPEEWVIPNGDYLSWGKQ
ncbi:MAG: gamma carbonic anhydrase family protein, partial [Saprospiraceae bacterium]